LNKIKSGNSVLETTFFLLMVWGVAVTGYSARLWFVFLYMGKEYFFKTWMAELG